MDPVFHVAANGSRDRCLRYWPCPTCGGGVEERRCRICELLDKNHPDYSEGMRRLYHPEEFPDEPAPAAQAVNGRLPSGHAVGGVRDESQSVLLDGGEVPEHLRPSRSGPGLLTRAASFTGAMVRQGAEMVRTRSVALVDQETYDARIALCQGCEHYSGNPAWPCRICGCHKVKINLATSTCPMKKWGAV